MKVNKRMKKIATKWKTCAKRAKRKKSKLAMLGKSE
jgi:hypothetical protein